MKAAALLFLLSAASTAGVSAQDAKRNFVVWNGDPDCGQRSRSLAGEAIRCSSLTTERGPVSVVTHNGVSLAVAFLEDDGYLVTAAQIKNTSSEPIAFDSDGWGAAHWASREAFRAGERPLRAETSVPTRDMLRGMSSDARSDSSIDVFMADIQRRGEVVETRRQDGTRVRRLEIRPDKEAQEAASNRKESRSQLTLEEQRSIRRDALTAKTVMPGASVKGLVYFRRLKKAGFVAFSISVADNTYLFLMPRGRRKA